MPNINRRSGLDTFGALSSPLSGTLMFNNIQEADFDEVSLIDSPQDGTGPNSFQQPRRPGTGSSDLDSFQTASRGFSSSPVREVPPLHDPALTRNRPSPAREEDETERQQAPIQTAVQKTLIVPFIHSLGTTPKSSVSVPQRLCPRSPSMPPPSPPHGYSDSLAAFAPDFAEWVSDQSHWIRQDGLAVAGAEESPDQPRSDSEPPSANLESVLAELRDEGLVSAEIEVEEEGVTYQSPSIRYSHKCSREILDLPLPLFRDRWLFREVSGSEMKSIRREARLYWEEERRLEKGKTRVQTRTIGMAEIMRGANGEGVGESSREGKKRKRRRDSNSDSDKREGSRQEEIHEVDEEEQIRGLDGRWVKVNR